MTAVQLPEVPVVRSLLRYEPDTGHFYWLQDRGMCRLAGKRAGSKDYTGYVKITINGSNYLAHRIAWLLTHGNPPDGEIDHINGIRNDNRIENLRVVSRRQNMQNCAAHRDGRLVGTIFHGRKWRAHMSIDGKRIDLGGFDTKEAAHDAYMRAIQQVEKQNE